MSDAITMLTGPDLAGSLLTKISLSSQPMTTVTSSKEGRPDEHQNSGLPLVASLPVQKFTTVWIRQGVTKVDYKENDTGTRIKIWNFNDFKHPALINLAKYYTYFRFDIEIRVQLTSNFQDIGFARLAEFPFDFDVDNDYIKTCCRDETLNSYKWTLIPYGVSSTTTVMLKWLAFRPFDLLGNLKIGNPSFGLFNYANLNLTSADFNPQFTVEYRLVNLQMAGPKINNG